VAHLCQMLELFSSMASVDNKVILKKTDVGNHAVYQAMPALIIAFAKGSRVHLGL